MLLQTIWQEIFNIYGVEFEIDIVHFIAYFIAMGAGALVFFYFDVRQSMKLDSTTPNKFNVKFLFFDNIYRFIVVIILISAMILLYKDIYGVPLNLKLAFSQGLSFDAIVGVLMKKGKEKGAWKRQRTKLATKYKNP